LACRIGHWVPVWQPVAGSSGAPGASPPSAPQSTSWCSLFPGICASGGCAVRARHRPSSVLRLAGAKTPVVCLPGHTPGAGQTGLSFLGRAENGGLRYHCALQNRTSYRALFVSYLWSALVLPGRPSQRRRRPLPLRPAPGAAPWRRGTRSWPVRVGHLWQRRPVVCPSATRLW
jgi:hypothetical protein